MTDDYDPAQVLADYGIETRLGGAPTSEAPLRSAGAEAQARFLHALGKLKASVEMLEASVRDNPNNDPAFDAINSALGQSLVEANAALQRFRERRDCVGAS